MAGRHHAAPKRKLHTTFATESRQAAGSGPRLNHLWNTASPTTDGGKLIRPRLFLSAMEALTPENPTVAPKEQIRLSAGLVAPAERG